MALPIVGVGTPSPKAGTITLSEPSGSPDLASPLIVSGTNAVNGNIDTPDVAVDVYAGDSTAGTLVEHGDPTPATNGAWRFSFSTDGLTAGDDYTVIAYQISADGSTTGSTTEPLTFEWGVGDPDSGSTSTPTSSPVSIS